MEQRKNKTKNIDVSTVDGFGDEWSRFKQEKLDIVDRELMFDDYLYLLFLF